MYWLLKMHKRQRECMILISDFIALYTTIPHNFLIKLLSEVINFVFKSKTRSRIGFSKTSIYQTSKGCGRKCFTTQIVIDVILFLTTKCYFMIKNLVFKQEIGIPVDIYLAPYWENLFLYFFESKFVQQLMSKGFPRVCNFHGTSRFTDNFCTLNFDIEFSPSYKYIYPKQLQLNLNIKENMRFLDLD